MSNLNQAVDRNIGSVIRTGDGFYWLTPEEIGSFSFPAAGEVGTGGRNTFRGPRYFNVDMLCEKVQDHRPVRQLISAVRLTTCSTTSTLMFLIRICQRQPRLAIAGTVGNTQILQMALRFESLAQPIVLRLQNQKGVAVLEPRRRSCPKA